MKKQIFYLLFTKPTDFKNSTNKYQTKIAPINFQSGKNIPDVPLVDVAVMFFLPFLFENILARNECLSSFCIG